MDASLVSASRPCIKTPGTMSVGNFLRRFIDREPVVSFSIAIAAFGLSLPFIVPPIR